MPGIHLFSNPEANRTKEDLKSLLFRVLALEDPDTPADQHSCPARHSTGQFLTLVHIAL
ncbi:MAG: hypothetical protein H6568_02970 [Lewinellaceae bacterium]|nr:hypothetical protein [Saprospiraceae bacterium]MCB9311702.1 hypothetical protein [Lewinellaceae bacterium]HRW75129.1 hypothetical protein [Saprospiraceae bacterium]